jgi:hypothetical protein
MSVALELTQFSIPEVLSSPLRTLRDLLIVTYIPGSFALFREFIPYLLFVSVYSLTLVFQLLIFKYAYDFSYDRSNLFSHHQHAEGKGSPKLVAISLCCID